MEATRAHKIRLMPTKAQERMFAQAAGNARFVYNWVLGENQRQYREYRDGLRESRPTVPALMKQLNAVKGTEFPWLLLSSQVVEDAALHVKDAFERFWKKQGRFPQFKSKHKARRCFTASLREREVRINGRYVRVPSFGWIHMREEVRFAGKATRVVISEEGGRWFASVSVTGAVDSSAYQAKDGESQAAGGIDVGLRTLITESDGTKHENPRALRNAQRRLRRAQRRLSRRQKGSANREKARRRVNRLHYRVKCIRENAIHNATTAVVRKYAVLGVESLNVKGMARNPHLALSVADASMSEALRQVEYKAKWGGKRVVEAGRFYPSSKTCNRCGVVNDGLRLSDERWACPSCGASHDRDTNAALNLRDQAAKATAIDAGSNACGVEGAGLSLVGGQVKPATAKQEEIPNHGGGRSQSTLF